MALLVTVPCGSNSHANWIRQALSSTTTDHHFDPLLPFTISIHFFKIRTTSVEVVRKFGELDPIHDAEFRTHTNWIQFRHFSDHFPGSGPKYRSRRGFNLCTIWGQLVQTKIHRTRSQAPRASSAPAPCDTLRRYDWSIMRLGDHMVSAWADLWQAEARIRSERMG